ncbi:PKD domain-containing protein [Ferruginibacter sp. HRS2-29]|uniref:gliding motility-associated C-terminal domain-containing protein n=1 Tax=Ferruginibacter sp. HRS2-29 TaxID=2487334 RepID=UPI0020CE1D29|nr:PKD domain-containing protein [Ferruginibacter sp. HRS2-29]MCP9750789.1 PKD domain-containing protein [Ferruginibacter sp. HRS2-29]
MLRLLFTLILLHVTIVLSAQDKSNRGKEFWLAYGYDYSFFNETPVNFQELALYISTEQAATVTVSITNTGYTQTLIIPANTVNASILIPKSGPDDARTLTDGLNNRGIHIVSNVPVAVYAHVYSTMVSGATMLMPVETYGYTYYSINYYQTTSQSSPNDWYSWFYAVATEDNTRLEITPSDTTKNGWLPGQTYTVNLNKGESYHVFGKAIFNGDPAKASKDMTGSKILSIAGADGKCHPVGVFSGSGGIRLCRGDGGEFVHQQVFPAQAWGTRYLTYHTANNTNTDIRETNRNYYRICVADPTAVVKKNGVVMTGLIKNFFYEYMDSTGGDFIESDKPVIVSQYTPNKNQCWNFPTTTPSPPSYGDPEMFYLSPIEQGQKSVLFYTSRKSSIDYVYANIHLPTAATASLRVDGNVVPAAQIIPHPNYPAYSVALVRFIGAAAQHRITCDEAFTATVYGIGNYESYGYNVGCFINNLNSYGSIKNTFNTSGNIDTFTCPKTQSRLFIKTAYLLTSIHWKLSEAGGGLNPNVDSVINNPVPLGNETINGRKYYTYTLQQDFTFTTPGTYTIPVTYQSPDIDNCGHTETSGITVVVKPGPSADFSVSAQNCLNDSLRFSGIPTSAGFNITQYLWTFEDNTSAGTVNTVKKFNIAGPQDVRYRIFADNGCTGDTTKVVNILESPVAKFGYGATLCAGSNVEFTDTSSVVNGSIVSWQWNFGDGQSETRSSGATFTHQYITAGSYTVYLVVTSDKGCKSDTLKRTFSILPKPVAKFGFDKDICISESVRFSDSSYVGQSLITWQWNFGDGNTANNVNHIPFNHPYTSAGNFTVSLVVTGSNGCKSDSFKLPVLVTAKPVVSFTSNGKMCIDSAVSFVSSLPFNSSAPATWYWDFGDGQTLVSNTSNSATHAYSSQLTNVTVRHAVKTGCASDTVYTIISIINPNPAAVFSILGDTLCENKPLSFIAPVNTAVTSWNWNFGNGTGSSVPPFTRSYAVAGNYSVSLKVFNTAGCGSNLANKTIAIGATPLVNAGPDLTIESGSSKTIQASISNPSQYQFLWSPSTYLNNAAILNPVTTPASNVTYRLMAINPASKCIGYDSMIVKIVTDIYVPSAFTPNNDTRNDTWKIPALEFYPDAMLIVFNRYGQIVFQSKGGGRWWDGTFKGQPQPQGSYVYILRPTANSIHDIKGTVMLLR